nr:RHS repeat-associated core domain-containing protein [Aeribacillus pallidus]
MSLLDGCARKHSARYQYDAWGNLLSQSGSLADENPYRYAGYQYDRETGLYYLIARYYHPERGVFLSMDPDPGDSMISSRKTGIVRTTIQ